MAVIINELEVRVAPEAPAAMAAPTAAAPAPSSLSAREVLLLVQQRRERDERLRAH